MFKNILVPTDGSDLAVKAVEQGVLFAKEIGATGLFDSFELAALPRLLHLGDCRITRIRYRSSNSR